MPKKTMSETATSRRFARVLVALLAALGGLAAYRGHHAIALAAATAGAAVALAAWLTPALWRRLFGHWMTLAEALSWFSTRVLLSIFFYGVLTPTALLMRLAGRRPLDLEWEHRRPSYWIDKPPVASTLARYTKQF